MHTIAFELYSHANVRDALIDTARAIASDYGAGTITNPRKSRDYLDSDFLGYWTAYPTDEAIANATLVVVMNFECGRGERADIIRKLAESTFASGEPAFSFDGDGMVQLGTKAVVWKYNHKNCL